MPFNTGKGGGGSLAAAASTGGRVYTRFSEALGVMQCTSSEQESYIRDTRAKACQTPPILPTTGAFRDEKGGLERCAVRVHCVLALVTCQLACARGGCWAQRHPVQSLCTLRRTLLQAPQPGPAPPIEAGGRPWNSRAKPSCPRPCAHPLGAPGMQVAAAAAKFAVAWRLLPVLPAAIAKMGSCLSVVLDVRGLRSRVAELEAQLAAAGAGGGSGVAAPGSSPAEVLFFPDPAMWVGDGGHGASGCVCRTLSCRAGPFNPGPPQTGLAATATTVVATTARMRTRAPACCASSPGLRRRASAST
jgi:hypothetical protein